jgi:hypothetical protein
MTRRITGAILILIAAILYSSHHLAASIHGSTVKAWEDLNGTSLVTLSVVSLVAGIGYLIWGEITETRSRGRK